MDITDILKKEFHLRADHLDNIISLLDAGNTIPFIARYRKEQTGSCDDQVLRELADRLDYLRGLEKRAQAILASLKEQDKLTEELERQILAADTLSRLEDIYRPYKQKRRTRATMAKEKGLEPLAEQLRKQVQSDIPEQLAAAFVDEEKGVPTADDALAGARDILAEQVSDSAAARDRLRRLFLDSGVLCTAATTEDDSVYRMYYDYSEPVKNMPSHRILAIDRGEKDGLLKITLQVPPQAAERLLYPLFVKNESASAAQVRLAVDDAYDRLLFPSLEREVRAQLTARAAEQAIQVFGVNLQSLLMSPPVKGKVVLGFDPAYRTGCKLAVVDENGRVLYTGVVYPTPPQNRKEEAAGTIRKLVEQYRIDLIAIGNGTASKESEIFIAGLLKTLPRRVQYAMVNEAGASVYSASKLGAQEFPDFDVSLRSAVSIARRLQDPLAELVKIDPKSIGVGQYQHDMPEKRLNETLDGVVEDCVNRVGADLNTASPALLSHIAGLGPATAKNVVAYREENGAFTGKEQLKKVAGIGPKAFEQCAGFVRIPGGRSPFDNTAVHPESYEAAQRLLTLFGFTEKDIGTNALSALPSLIRAKGEAAVAQHCGVGVPTLTDMAAELCKPGRDIRDDAPAPVLRDDILDMKDLKEGMQLRGTVRNAVDFGVFVDIGVHQDGLVHISQMTDRYIKHPSEVVKVGDVVTVYVLGVDVAKKRISLTMKPPKEKRQ